MDKLIQIYSILNCNQMIFKKIFILICVFIISINISKAQASYGTQIGWTCYDLQTNSAIRNGLVSNSDGTIAAVWTQKHDCGYCPVGFLCNRGIGYNYFDGTSWIYGIEGECPVFATYGCASQYVGWPNIMWTDSAEIVITHTPLKINIRSTRGAGSWGNTDTLPLNPSTFGGNLWPRAVADGNYIHVIASSQNGIANGVIRPLVYHRSSDGAVTWDIQNYILPGIDSTLFDELGADSYAIDAKNGTIAITAGGFGQPWVMWKSAASGDTGTWNYTIIAPFDTAGKTIWHGDSTGSIWTYDNAHALTIGYDGVVHATVGEIVVIVDSITGKLSSFAPGADSSLYYWNENLTGPVKIAAIVDLANPITGDPPDGTAFSGLGKDWPAYYLGWVSMSQISVDLNNNIYVVYTAPVEWTSNTGDTSGQSFRDIYLVYSTDSGNTWSKEINIAGEIAVVNVDSSGTGNEEDVYPMTNKRIGADNLLHIVWQEDGEPGTMILDNDPYAINYIMHFAFDVTTIIPFVSDIEENPYIKVTNLSSIYPNPFSDHTTISYSLKEGGPLTLHIYNMYGQLVKALVNEPNLQKGIHRISFDASSLQPGLYYYIFSTKTFSETKKMLIIK